MEFPKRLPDSELEVMMIIWERGEQVSTSDIMAGLHRKTSVQQVQNSLNRLERKGFVRCQKLGRLNHYTPLIPLEDYRVQETASFVEKLYHNSAGKLFAALIQSHPLSREEVEEIRALLKKEEE